MKFKAKTAYDNQRKESMITGGDPAFGTSLTEIENKTIKLINPASTYSVSYITHFFHIGYIWVGDTFKNIYLPLGSVLPGDKEKTIKASRKPILSMGCKGDIGYQISTTALVTSPKLGMPLNNKFPHGKMGYL